MSFRFEASSRGPLAGLLEKFALPAFPATAETAAQEYSLWAIRGENGPCWVLFPASRDLNPNNFPLHFRDVDDWLPGMVFLYRRHTSLRAAVASEYSALFTSLASPVQPALSGDVGLDLDLGLRAEAGCQAEANCWFLIERPLAAATPQLRLRLASAGHKARQITVRATGASGLDQATRNTLGALAGRHRSQLLARLRRGIWQGLDRAAVIRQATQLDPSQPAAVQAFQALLDNPSQALWEAIDTYVPRLDAQAAALSESLDKAVRSLLERHLHADLSLAFSRSSTRKFLLDATLDFSVPSPGLAAIFRAALQGDPNPVLAAPTPGLTLHSGFLSAALTRRRTFSWRLPWTSGRRTLAQQIESAVQSLDIESGRLSRGSASVVSAHQACRAASILQLEATLAALVSPQVVVHTPAAASARFHLDIQTNRPQSLLPLVSLYGLPEIPAAASRLQLTVVVAPAALAPWLENPNANDVSRRVQHGWRTLLPALVDMDEHNLPTAAPLLVWASLPVTAGAELSGSLLKLDTGKDSYWDHRDPALRQAMMHNARTLENLAARLAHTHLDATPEQVIAACASSHGQALLNSLLHVEATLAARVPELLAHMARVRASLAAPLADYMKHCSALLALLDETFHAGLTSVYGPGIAGAAGPLLLAAATQAQPHAEAQWS